MKFSDYLFAPSDWAYENLINMKIKGKKLNIKQNTNVEAMYHSMQHSSRIATHEKDYCVMTIHRVETILKKERLRFVVKAAERISNDLTLFFIMHPPTYEKLAEFGLLDRIVGNKNIFTSGLKRHRTFLNLLANANFVITDGGSIQEETYYLGVPCLIMRCETERQEGIGSNAQKCNFSTDILEKFLANYVLFKRKNTIENNQPSAIILNELISELNYNFSNKQ
jgi:UDP-N-acetylglucosamine 2-epimerase